MGSPPVGFSLLFYTMGGKIAIENQSLLRKAKIIAERMKI